MSQPTGTVENKQQSGAQGPEPGTSTVAFEDVFRTELSEIRVRHERRQPGDPSQRSSTPIPEDSAKATPTTRYGLTGITCSGGGIRSAAFCLGVLQGLQSKEVINSMDYLSTVSGGGYTGTMMTMGMSSDPAAAAQSRDGTFPFGRLGAEQRETPEVRHLRDNSRYLLQNGLPGVASAIVIYLRGIAMNAIVVLPILLVAAALLVALNPDTNELVTNRILWFNLTGWFGNSKIPFTLLMICVVAVLVVVYAVAVSISPIAPLQNRQRAATIAGWIFFLALLVVLLELHALLLRLVFEASPEGYIDLPAHQTTGQGAHVFDAVYQFAKRFALLVAPLVVAILPFLKNLASKAAEGEAGGWADFIKRLASRVLLIVVAMVVPLLLWLAMMQLAFWGTAVSTCLAGELGPTCQLISNEWPHAPAWLQSVFEFWPVFFGLKVPLIYLVVALVLFAFWLLLSVNANSLHQLYRDRLGSAFLVKRNDWTKPADEAIDPADTFSLTAIDPKQAPYQLINAALNVPGSRFANRRGRNADFFLFSRCYVGSDATEYVATKWAEKAVDGLNIGTAMAISGAAAAPNMGTASIRPLSPTIALLNVRLGRWVRHPRDIARRASRLQQEGGEESQWFRFPRPKHLLLEAFSKSGAGVKARDVEAKDSGFVFLTDGGHVDNLGLYELLRRRCRLIIAIDAEADPELTAGSLVQVERFARIDLHVSIRMNWIPIGARTRAVTEEMKKNAVARKEGPHVAVGVIDYPPSAVSAGKRESGVLIYIKASVSGDENDYVNAYKAAYPRFPHEATADQLFSEQQFEAYRALGEHIGARFIDGRDPVAVFADDQDALAETIKQLLPKATVRFPDKTPVNQAIS